MFSCRHLDTSSDRLFKILLLLRLIIWSFSAKHNFTSFARTVIRRALAMIDHLVVKLVLLSFSCQTYFDSSVLLESFLWVNVDLC